MRADPVPSPAPMPTGETTDFRRFDDVTLRSMLNGAERHAEAVQDGTTRRWLLRLVKHLRAERKMCQMIEASEAARMRDLDEIREREAACCPEDVGFDEYIRALEAKLSAPAPTPGTRTEETDALREQLATYEREAAANWQKYWDVYHPLTTRANGYWSPAESLVHLVEAEVRRMMLPENQPVYGPAASRMIALEKGAEVLRALAVQADPESPAVRRLTPERAP